MSDGSPVVDSPVVMAPASLTLPRKLRLWPALLIIAIQLGMIFVPGWIVPGTYVAFMSMFYAPFVGGALLLVWWLFLSRAPWLDRILVPVVAITVGLAMTKIADKTMPFGLLLYGVPTICTVWVAWLAITGGMNWPTRRIGLLCTLLLAWGYFGLIRLDGIEGNMKSAISWRWMPTAEQRFLAAKQARPAVAEKMDAAASPEEITLDAQDWPEFRGTLRDGVLDGVSIATDWSSAPKLIWKQRIGPGWGSIAVVGERLFTQEQRGQDEAIVCYSVKEGSELWAHTDPSRFEEVVAGAGPRATPTFHNSRIYALGANGLLNCLHAATGEKIWSADTAKVAEAKVPAWGFSGSPLIVGKLVVILLGNPTGSAMLAYDAATGEKRWTAGPGSHTYSSPHLTTIEGVEQILSMTDAGLTSVNPTTGEVLWNYEWPMKDAFRVLQPLVIGDTVLIGSNMEGCKLIRVSHEADKWSTAELWKSLDIKPNFNDFVLLDGNLYGFDANILSCIDLETGMRKWKRGRYGFGQVLLLKSQKLLLVQAESGDVALVEANPAEFVEKGKFPALTGKTWNHPVIAHGKLFVRNAEEMACYDVTPANVATVSK